MNSDWLEGIYKLVSKLLHCEWLRGDQFTVHFLSHPQSSFEVSDDGRGSLDETPWGHGGGRGREEEERKPVCLNHLGCAKFVAIKTSLHL